MNSEDNKTLARRFIEEVFVRQDEAAADRLAAADFTPHSWPGVEPGVANLKAGMKRVSKGLTDVWMKIEDVVAKGDKVAVRLSAHAVQSGEFMGLPPSGKAYTVPEMHVFRVKDGKVAEHWSNVDMLGIMQQLGALPNPSKKAA